MKPHILFCSVLSSGVLSVACDDSSNGKSNDNVYESYDGRTITWDGSTLTLNNKDTLKDPKKKFVVLKGVGSIPTSSPLLFERATLNQISNKTHHCSGSVEASDGSLTIGIGGDSDRCALFNGIWYNQGSALQTAKNAGLIPSDFKGTFSKEGSSDSITIEKDKILGTFPNVTQEHDKNVELSLYKGSSTGRIVTVEGDLNKINGKVKKCSGSIEKDGSTVVLQISGDSSRCSRFSGTWK